MERAQRRRAHTVHVRRETVQVPSRTAQAFLMVGVILCSHFYSFSLKDNVAEDVLPGYFQVLLSETRSGFLCGFKISQVR